LKTDETKQKEGEGAEDDLLALKDQLGNMQHYYDTANAHMLEAFGRRLVGHEHHDEVDGRKPFGLRVAESGFEEVGSSQVAPSH